MKHIKLGKSDIVVSQIALGCMGLGGSWDANAMLTKEDEKVTLQIVDKALEQGINFFDHADIYKRGKAETVFSSIWDANLVKREDIYIQSKCGIRLAGDLWDGSAPHYDFSYDHIIKSVDESLERLKTDYLDGLLLHRPDTLMEPEEVAKAFSELKSSGKVRYFGVSNHNGAQIDLLQSYLDEPLMTNQMEMSLVQANLIDEGLNVNSLLNPLDYRSQGTLEYCRRHQITLQAWSPLAGGALTSDVVLPEYEEMAKLIRHYANEFGVSPEAIVIAWLLRHPAKIQPIVGTTTPARLQAICEAKQVQLTREQWYRLYNSGIGRKLL